MHSWGISSWDEELPVKTFPVDSKELFGLKKEDSDKEKWLKLERSSERLYEYVKYMTVLDGMCFWTYYLRKGIESIAYFYRGVQVIYFYFMHNLSSDREEIAGHP